MEEGVKRDALGLIVGTEGEVRIVGAIGDQKGDVVTREIGEVIGGVLVKVGHVGIHGCVWFAHGRGREHVL